MLHTRSALNKRAFLFVQIQIQWSIFMVPIYTAGEFKFVALLKYSRISSFYARCHRKKDSKRIKMELSRAKSGKMTKSKPLEVK